MNNVLRPRARLVGLLEHSAEDITTLAGLTDVDLTDIEDGQLLRYNGETGKFENFTLEIPEVPVQDVEVDGESVVNAQGVAEITLPDVPVQDVEVDGESVVNAQGVAEITLPDVPVQDVEFNGVSVVNAQGVAEIPLHTYSATEQRVGTWINGKPIYEKTITINTALLTGNDTYINHNISNMNYCINIRAIGLLNTGGAAVGFLILPDAHSSDEWEVGIYNITDTFFDIHLGNGVKNIGFQSMYAIIQYTKTTD